MPQIRLVPSTYYLSNSSYLSVSNASNMYANTDSTTYATVTNSRTQTTSYYIYIRGFNFSDVPSDVIVNSITIKLKAYHSGGNTGTIGGYNDTSSVSSAGTTTALGTSATVKTFTNTTIDWDTLKGYGSNFGIRINCRRSSRNTTSYVYIYGAEILVDYTIPVYHSVSFSNTSSVSISPATTQSVIEGNDLTIQINTSNKNAIRVSDNNVDVSSQVVQGTGSCTYTISNVQADHTISITDAPSYNVSITNTTETVTTQPSSTQTLFEGDGQEISFYNISSLDDVVITDNSNDIESQLVHSTGRTRSVVLNPSALYSSSTTVTNQNNACTDTSSTTYARMPIGQQEENNMIYSFDVSQIPSNATINSVSCVVKASTSTSNNITTKDVQLYSGTSPKGSISTIPTTTGGTVTLSPGTWTRQELENIRIRFDGYYSGTYSSYNIDFYGAELTVNYTVVEDVYIYTISNISADHIISVSDASQISDYIKLAGEYKKIKKYYRKVNGSWVELSKEAFDQAVTSQVIMYGGSFGPSVYDEYGVVEKTASGTTITLDDTNLTSGNYTLKYEDSARNPISNVDDITTITVS